MVEKLIGNEWKVKVTDIKEITHNVREFTLERPEGYEFKEGQATEVSIDVPEKPELRDKKRPFTFTCNNSDDFLQFTIKMYDDHDNGMTKNLRELNVGDSLLIRDVWGAIEYKGPGVFIAGGSGVTPFIAILRKLRKSGELGGNMLIFSNKTSDDIILEDEFKEMEKEGLKLVLTLTKEDEEKAKEKGCKVGRINKDFLESEISDWKQKFYVCGPVGFVGELQDALKKLGAEAEEIVFEK